MIAPLRRFVASVLTTEGEKTIVIEGKHVSDAEDSYRKTHQGVIYCVVRSEVQ